MEVMVTVTVGGWVLNLPFETAPLNIFLYHLTQTLANGSIRTKVVDTDNESGRTKGGKVVRLPSKV